MSSDPATGQALVVGASSRIGGAIAEELARLGYGLSLWGRDGERLRQVVTACEPLAGPHVLDLVDVTSGDQVRTGLRKVAARGPLKVVVWAAGLFDWGSAGDADPRAWERVIGVNLTAAASITPLVLPMLIAAAPSALIYLGSAASRQVYANNAAYVAAKHGLAGLAGATFLDVRNQNVKVSLISPGLVAAGAGLESPAGQARPELLLHPEDVASAVRFVVTFPERGCPVELQLQPQRDPDGRL